MMKKKNIIIIMAIWVLQGFSAAWGGVALSFSL